MKTYNLTLTETQLRTVQKALDCYSRIGMGQCGTAITDHPDVIRRIFEDSDNAPGIWDVSCGIDVMIKSMVFTELTQGSFHGIRSEHIDESNRVAYDILQVIRHRLAWDNHKEGDRTIYVSYDRPLKTSGEPLPNIGENL